MSSPLRIYFLRHGQTEESRENHFCGSGRNPSLTPDGDEMALSFAQAYEGFQWKAIYSSPLSRAIATASHMVQKANIPLQTRVGLQEIAYGAWEGRTVEDINESHHDDYIRWSTDPAWCPPTGGETAISVAERAKHVVDEILKIHSSGNVLVVSHKATIRIALCDLLGIDLGRFRFRLDCPTCSVSVVEFRQQGPFLKILADRSHLSERLRLLPGT